MNDADDIHDLTLFPLFGFFYYVCPSVCSAVPLTSFRFVCAVSQCIHVFRFRSLVTVQLCIPVLRSHCT